MPINEAIVVLMVGIGTLCGSLLTRIAPEEMDDGKVYFRYFYALMGGLVGVAALWPYFGYYSIFALIVSVLLYLNHDVRFSLTALSVLLPITIIKSSINPTVLAVILFICALTAGTINSSPKAEAKWKEFLSAQGWIALLTIIDFLVYYFI